MAITTKKLSDLDSKTTTDDTLLPVLNDGEIVLGKTTKGDFLDGKVDKVAGKGLSTNDYTDSEKTKLAGIEDNATADQTDAEIKTAYENNANTNCFTDSEKTKLSHITVTQNVNLNNLQTDLDSQDQRIYDLEQNIDNQFVEIKATHNFTSNDLRKAIAYFYYEGDENCLLASNVQNSISNYYIGILTKIIDSTTLQIQTSGIVKNFFTNKSTNGEYYYVDTNGNLTPIKPTGNKKVILVGYTINQNSNDLFLVSNGISTVAQSSGGGTQIAISEEPPINPQEDDLWICKKSN